ncbi:MAG: LCP family protein [Microthrixaceae bacterium]
MGTGGKLRRTWPQRLLLGFNALLVIACLGAAAGLYTFQEKLSEVDTVAINSASAEPLDPGEVRNVLIIGTDSAANLDEGDPVNSGRQGENLADVIMILRIDPSDGTARLLSIPRDTRVALAPGGEMGKINAAMFGVDGPRNLIDTIRRNFGISIDNYIEVDFAAFKSLVDQLGGVPVYFAAPVRDKNSGLFVEEPGCVVLAPDQALAYARSRHFQYRDENGRWRYDQTGDLGRITRQQDFIKRAMRRASGAGLRNPGTAIGIVDAATGAVKMDDTLSVGTILALVDVFRTFNPDDLETQQIKTLGDMIGEISYQQVVWDETLPMLLPMWGFDMGEVLTVNDIVVDVVGSRSDTEQADLLATALDGVGFDASVLVSRNAPSGTTITFGDAGFDAALTLAGYLEGEPELIYDSEIVGPRLELTVDEDFAGVRETPVAPADLPASVRTAPSEYLEVADQAAEEAAEAEQEAATEGVEGEPVEDTTTSLAIDDDLEFVQAAEAEGAAPGIVPTDPVQEAACT